MKSDSIFYDLLTWSWKHVKDMAPNAKSRVRLAEYHNEVNSMITGWLDKGFSTKNFITFKYV